MKKKLSKLELEHKEYNKHMRSLNFREKTLEEYIAYRKGKSKYKPKVVKGPMDTGRYYRTTPKYESGVGIGVAFSKQEKKYTGNEILGIAAMHKSNLVPVRKDNDDAKDIARMRRN